MVCGLVGLCLACGFGQLLFYVAIAIWVFGSELVFIVLLALF